MSAPKNKGGVVLKLIVVLVLLSAAGYAVFHNLQGTARVKAAGRDTAFDAVTGSVLVHADGGMKELKSEAAGKVTIANIKPGSRFKKGDVLVQLDTTDLDRDIREAKRAYEDARERNRLRREGNVERQVTAEKLETAKRLLSLGSASQEDVNNLQRALAAIDLNLKLADLDEVKAKNDYEVSMERYVLQRTKMSITAPFDGAIEGSLVIESELIGAGQPVANIYSSKRVVAAKISEENFGRVRVDQIARLRLLTYGSQIYDAKVSELLPTADEAQRFTVYLDVDVDPEQLKPGSTGEVTITLDQRPNQVMIPRRALFDSNKVLVVLNGRVQRREVEVGYVALNVVEIRRGIGGRAGDSRSVGDVSGRPARARGSRQLS